jgi:hypothetical protein
MTKTVTMTVQEFVPLASLRKYKLQGASGRSPYNNIIKNNILA